MKLFLSIRYVFLLGILIIASFLRLYQLGTNPPSIDWDEASLGYNAYSIEKTGADEYGTKFPLSIRSFDDYKPALYVYLDIPFVWLMGLTELSVRLPSALLGIVTVLAVYLLVREVFAIGRVESWRQETIALLSSFFVSVSPWNLQFSRAAFEGNIGLCFLVIGMWLLLKSIHNKIWFIFACFSFVLTMYSYHSFRIVTPLVLLCAIVLFWKQMMKEKIFFIAVLIGFVCFCLPIAFGFLQQASSGSRLAMVSLFSDPQTISHSIVELSFDQMHHDKTGLLFHNRRIVYAVAILRSYFTHFNPDFLFFTGDSGVQHHAVDIGMLYIFDIPFLILGGYFFLKILDRKIALVFILLLLGPVPSAVGTGAPHAVRAIALSIPLLIITAGGVWYAALLLQKTSRSINTIAVGMSVVIFLFNVAYYLHQYYVHTPIEYGYFWQYGYKELFSYLSAHESAYQKIIVTYRYDQPYIYYLFYNKIEPLWYQKHWDYLGNGEVERMRRVIGKYEFRNINWDKDRFLNNTLLAGTPNELSRRPLRIRDEIYFPDGSLAFRVVSLP